MARARILRAALPAAAALTAAGACAAAAAGILIDFPSISPDGDGVKDSMTVTIELGAALDTLMLTVEDKSSPAVYDTLLFEVPSEAGEKTASWDGTDAASALLPEGSYDLRLYEAGGTSTLRTVIIDTTAAVVTLDRIEPGVYSPGRPDTSAAVTVYFDISGWGEGTAASLTVTGPESFVSTSQVEVAGDGSWSARWKSASAPSGGYAAEVSTLDEAGNSSSDSGNFMVDSDGPGIELITQVPSNTREVPAELAGAAWDMSGAPGVELSWTGPGEDESGRFAPDSSRTDADTLYFVFETPDTVSGEVSYVEGGYTLKVFAVDAFGRQSTGQLQFALDRTPPEPPVIAPLPPRVIYEVLEVDLSWGEGVDSVFVYRAHEGDTTRVGRSAEAVGAGDRPTVVLGEGENSIFASAVDRAGNSSGYSSARDVFLDVSAGTSYPEAFRGPGIFQVVLASEAASVRVEIFDMRGERVRRLHGGGPGRTFEIVWDLLDDDGDQVRNGAYFAVILVDREGGEAVLEKSFVAVVR